MTETDKIYAITEDYRVITPAYGRDYTSCENASEFKLITETGITVCKRRSYSECKTIVARDLKYNVLDANHPTAQLIFNKWRCDNQIANKVWFIV
jgi:hypothetical protein